MSNIFNDSRLAEKKKITQKYQEMKRKDSQKLKEIIEKEKVS